MDKVVSIDMWGTLIKGNPAFSEAKIDLVKKYFPDLTSERIKEVFDYVKTYLNDSVELTGYQHKMGYIYSLLTANLAGKYNRKKINLLEFYEEYQDLVLTHPPLLYCEKTKEHIETLSKHATLYISSNTMFISGAILKDVLKHYDMLRFFKRLNFSDQMECAKPDAVMYMRSHYHIGDNEITDGHGAQLAGSIPIIINSNEKTLSDAVSIIISNK